VLSKAYWNRLAVLNLRYNFISIEGVQILARANWKHLQCLFLEDEPISKKDKDDVVKL
jgi:Ran GTPase-activating protein (RanGAP) involved in mRNA processing and transport